MFSVVKMMKEQGNQFDWSQIAIDIPSLPCFDQKKMEEAIEKAVSGQEPMSVEDILSEGYALIVFNVGRQPYSLVVRQTGDDPSISGSLGSLDFVDCEPINVLKVEQVFNDLPNLPILPFRTLLVDLTFPNEPLPVLGVKELLLSTEESSLSLLESCTIRGNDNFLYLGFKREYSA